MSKKRSNAVLIVDYNLSRVSDVELMANYIRSNYKIKVGLVRNNPPLSLSNSIDFFVDLDPRSSTFVTDAKNALDKKSYNFLAGYVFSDDAVESGARLLEKLKVRVDSSELAINAFCKLSYRLAENKQAVSTKDSSIFVPKVKKVESLKDIENFALQCKSGIVLKPTSEGNNRGVIQLENPTKKSIKKAYEEVKTWVEKGLVAEEKINFSREYSVDGIGRLVFVTEKLSADGAYPVEYGQLLPADVNTSELETLLNASIHANRLVGQSQGPFHNEIRISNDGIYAAVVEPNRRPGGMKIWTLAEHVYGVNLYKYWIDLELGSVKKLGLSPKKSALLMMLPSFINGVSSFKEDIIKESLDKLKISISFKFGKGTSQIKVVEMSILDGIDSGINYPPKDNSDFLASIMLVSELSSKDLKVSSNEIMKIWRLLIQDLKVNYKKVVA